MPLFSAPLLILQTDPASAHGLNTAGWIFISIAWLAIISVAVFCFGKVIRLAEAKKPTVEGDRAREGSR